MVYDRRARTFKPFGGGALSSPEDEVHTQAGGGGASEADSDSDTDRDEEADEEQAVALQRYEMAHAVINAREELRQQRQDERAPSIGMRIRSLRDALAQGVQYGTVPGAADTKHMPGCPCHACTLVAAEADKLASSERGQATLTMAPVAQWTPCPADCSCDTCRWTRQRIQNMVLAGGSETARVAGLMHLRLIQNKQRRLARPKAITKASLKKAALARAAARDASPQKAAEAD